MNLFGRDLTGKFSKKKNSKSKRKLIDIHTVLVHNKLGLLVPLELIRQNVSKLVIVKPIQDVSIAVMSQHRNVAQNNKRYRWVQ